MTSYRNLLLAGAVASAFVGLGLPAHAQNRTAADNTLGEVVVTARRRAESVQDVPQSVIAFDQQALTRKAVSNAFDLDKVAPGLSIDGDSSTHPNYSIRGRGLTYGAAAGSVETYFADVPLSGPFAMPTLPAQYFDLQSVQVLKGPQGTLFGRNTTGGAVVLVPQAPTNTFGGYARLQAGDFADKQFEGAINVPIVEDKVLLRASAFLWQRHGYGKTAGGVPDESTGKILPSQDFNNQNTKEFRVSLLVRPMDHLTNTTIVTYHWDKTRATEAAGWNLFGPAAIPGSVAMPLVPGQPPVFKDPQFGTYGVNTFVNLDKPANTAWGVVNTTTYDLTPDLMVKNIFGFIHATGYTATALDSDGSILPIVDLPLVGHENRNNQWTDELQLQGKALDGRLTYTLGGLVDRTFEPGDPQHINYSSQLFVAGAGFSSTFTQSNFNSKSLYGAGAFKLTDQLNLSAGYRYSWDDVYAKAGGVFSPSPGAAANSATPFVSFTRSFGGATYNADLQWRPTARNMFYGGYRHGLKRGGFNPTVTDPTKIAFGPEKVDDYFVGSKNDFTLAGMRGRLNGEFFYDKYTGAQAAYVDFNLATGALSSPVINVPSTKYYGVDIDFALDPTDWLTLTGSYAYLHAKNGPWPDTSVPGSTIDLSVNPVAYSPQHKYAVTTRFHTELPNAWGEVALAPTLSYQAKSYTYAYSAAFPESQNIAANVFHGTIGTPQFFRLNQNAFGASSSPQHTLLDLRAEWNHAMGSKLDLAAQVTNLTNKYYSLGSAGGTLAFGAGGFVLAPPRMFFLEARTTF